MTTLRDLIAWAGDEDRPVWLDADRLAVDRLGAPLARSIQWGTAEDSDECLLGRLAGDDQAVTLRFEPDWEPGTARLHVQVPCPEDPACPGPAWDVITSRHDLLLTLDAGEGDDPWCRIHHGDQ